MQNNEIGSFSVSKLIEVCGLRAEDMYFEGCLIASRLDMDIANNLFRYPVRMNAYAIAFCSKGTITLTSNLNQYTLKAHDLYVNLPGSILQVEAVDDAEVYVVTCEEAFIRRINVDLKLLTRLFFQVEKHPLVPLQDKDWKSIIQSFEEIEMENAKQINDLYTAEVIRTALRLIIYKVCRIISLHLEHQHQLPFKLDRKEEYFHRFMYLLEKHYLEERTVGFYASQLNLTPKYLTTLIRQTSGKTVISWIDAYVILVAKNLLKYSTLNIQEIAYYLKFANQSFFGRYFKNHTGMTPSEYRAQL